MRDAHRPEPKCLQSTGELIDIERVTISSEGGRWKSTHRGNSLAAYPTSRPVLRRGVRGNSDSLADRGPQARATHAWEPEAGGAATRAGVRAGAGSLPAIRMAAGRCMLLLAGHRLSLVLALTTAPLAIALRTYVDWLDLGTLVEHAQATREAVGTVCTPLGMFAWAALDHGPRAYQLTLGQV